MAADKTLDLDVAAITGESRRLARVHQAGSGNWDVIVVGSGAAGGMAAFQLATARRQGPDARGRACSTTRRNTGRWVALLVAAARPTAPSTIGPSRSPSTASLDRPYAANPQMASTRKVTSYAGTRSRETG